MRKHIKGSLFVLGFLLVLIQFVRTSRINPPVDPAREIAAVHPTTPAVSTLLQRSCNDCHSNRTVWPWYSNVAPASWLVAHDVNDGRDALNLSEWTAYDAEKQQKLIGKMCAEVKDHEMPEPQYTLMHPRARLNASDVQTLCSWAQQVGTVESENREEDD